MHINITEFALQKQIISNKIIVTNLERLKDIFEGITGELNFTLQGETDNKNRPVLKLAIYGKITASCQICLDDIELSIDHNIAVPVFANEKEFDLALLDKENSNSDGVVDSDEFDVFTFVEDEIIMLLPIAPKHQDCQPV